MEAPFRRITVLGTGLVGGSFALALKRAFADVHITGWDRPEVLERARDRGAIEERAVDVAAACRESDLVYVALPVEETIRRLPEIAAAAPASALVTDAASTKGAVCRAAERAFLFPGNFVGGHPMAGKEGGGIDNAEPDLFRDAPYVLIGQPVEGNERVRRLVAVIEAIGARPVWLEADAHDRLAAFLSHLPQIAAVALAETVLDGTGEAASMLAGTGLRDSLRLAGSPYDVWADIFHTNPHLDEALEGMARALDRLRSRLQTDELREDFARSNHLYRILRRLE